MSTTDAYPFLYEICAEHIHVSVGLTSVYAVQCINKVGHTGPHIAKVASNVDHVLWGWDKLV